MARSDVRTWLSLDRWAQIIGLNPLNFNQLSSNSLFPNNTCGDIFFQYDWQNSDRLGRDTIAMAIQAAEREMAAEAGFNLLPDWTVDERVPYAIPAVPGMNGYGGRNPRGLWKSVELAKGHVLSGGVRTKTLIQAGVAITRQDDDVDGYAETCVVNVNTSVTDINEIRVFYPAKSGADGWEIRPILVTISNGIANIQFKAWQAVAANQMEALDAAPLDAHAAGSYETTVDVYRVYNDPQTQVSFLWESTGDCDDCCGTCVACQFGTQAGCFHTRDPRLGMVAPSPAAWDSSDSAFDSAEWSVCREPDQVRAWYYSGWQNTQLTAPKVQLDPYWEYAIAYYACSKFERPVCGCSNVQQFIDKWRVDAMVQPNGVTIVTTPEMLANRLGTSMGALYAWKRIHQNGVRVVK